MIPSFIFNIMPHHSTTYHYHSLIIKFHHFFSQFLIVIIKFMPNILQLYLFLPHISDISPIEFYYY